MEEDRKLWKRISAGDTAAFDTLYRENAPRLRAFLKQITGDLHTAEDLVQETFARIWKNPGGFNPDRGGFRAYLFGAGRKRAAEWWRRYTPTDNEIEERASRANTELRSMIGDAMERLPAEQRLLLWLREVEGQSYEELAAIFEIPLGTVRSRLFAAREALRGIWHGTRDEKGVSHGMR